MNHSTHSGNQRPSQYLISILTVILIAGLCYISVPFAGYRTVALILLVAVSILAMLFDIIPVLLAAILSAVTWNFFFIPPLFTFHIDTTEDLLMFSLYFIIALLNAVLTFKIREAEKKARDKEEKENAIKLYNTLLNSLSHEFRTPIATIIGSVDTLKENRSKISSENQNELLDQIGMAGIRLNRHVENLLNMNRLETGMLRLNLDWCDVNELIHSVISKIVENDEHAIRFHPEENLPLCKLDRGLMEQVLINLIHNAINYTPANSVVDIKASYEEGKINIQVADTGSGITANELPFIFDKFYRIAGSKPGGSGLGLSIVKGFVEAHHGEVKVRSANRSGTVFTVEIPTETSYIHNLKNE